MQCARFEPEHKKKKKIINECIFEHRLLHTQTSMSIKLGLLRQICIKLS